MSMNIRVKTIAPKEATVSISLDALSAEVVGLFFGKAVDVLDMSRATEEIFNDIYEEGMELTVVDIEETLAAVISALRGGVA